MMIGYPEVVLALWGPLVVRSAWAVWRRTGAMRAAPRSRAHVATAVAVAPLLAFLVPFDPSTPLRDLVPWRMPLAYGISDAPPSDALHSLAGFLLMLLTVVPLASIVASFAIGAVEVLVSERRLARAVVARRGDVRVLSERHATGPCVSGLLFPRIHASRSVLDGPDADVVLAHESSHRRHRHPLLRFVTVCAVRAWWWIPGGRSIREDVVAATEEWADADARRRVGDHRVACALLAAVRAGSSPAGRGPVGVAGMVGAAGVLERRITALATPVRHEPVIDRLVAAGGIVIALLVFVVVF
ncbi:MULTISPECIES: M56 family metallopeptidase [Clavibacter]|uniref:M56 family metallopeptidase n=1 Tax=Clavibacter TaxID=1573 RepID=UPI0012DD15AC|nr:MULTISPECIES: M56 family metallopeptidase [Clavibacter]